MAPDHKKVFHSGNYDYFMRISFPLDRSSRLVNIPRRNLHSFLQPRPLLLSGLHYLPVNTATSFIIKMHQIKLLNSELRFHYHRLSHTRYESPIDLLDLGGCNTRRLTTKEKEMLSFPFPLLLVNQEATEGQETNKETPQFK